MARIAVLGSGLVGSFVATEMARKNTVSLFDPDKLALERVAQRAPTVELHAERFSSVKQLEGCDMALNCLPGSTGHTALMQVIDAGVDCIDMSFTEQDPRVLDSAARKAGSTVIPDAGIAPGFSNLLAAELAGLTPQQLEIFVGGLPLRRDLPWEYAAPFSPADVVAEYERPARLKRGGHAVAEPALSDCHPFQLASGLVPNLPDGVALEAFLTDGLRSLLDLPIPEMAEYTLRYPGHATRFVELRDSGALAGEARNATLALLFEAWRLQPSESEFTHLQVLATLGDGTQQGWVVHDNGAEGWSSMARTTGLTACAFAEQLLAGHLGGPGVLMPEACLESLPRIRGHIQARGISVERVA